MKDKTTKPADKPASKGNSSPTAASGITASWVIKNLLAVIVVVFLLNKLALYPQPEYKWTYKWPYEMLKGNLEATRHYTHTTTDQRFEMKLGLSYVYLRYLQESTPPDAVILLPSKEAFFPEGQEHIFSGEPYNKMWATRFLYPRRVILDSELGKTPWSEKITHVAIVNGVGYEYLDYEVPQKAPHAILPIHQKQ